MLLDELPEGYAHLVFHGAWVVDVAGDAENLGARVVGAAESGEPVGAAPQYGRRHGDGFHVVDRCRTAIQAGVGGKRGLEARHPLPAFQAFEEGGLLAADVGAGADVEMYVEVPVRAAGVLADQPGLIGLADGPPQGLGLAVELAAYVNVAHVGAHGDAGEQRALQQLMGLVAKDFPVLAGAGLALVGVDHQVVGPAVGDLGHEGPFHSGAEAGAAASPEPRVLHLVDDPVAAPGDQRLGIVPVAARPRALQAHVLESVKVGENAVGVAEHHEAPGLSPRPSPRPSDCPVRVVSPPAGSHALRSLWGPGLGVPPFLSSARMAVAVPTSRSS